jgi:restriction endonuclease Mrr
MFPAYAEIEAPLLAELRRRGGSARPADTDANGRSVYEALAEYFKLSGAEHGEVIYERGNPRSRWENMVRYAVRSLRAQGLIARGEHGVWRIAG